MIAKSKYTIEHRTIQLNCLQPDETDQLRSLPVIKLGRLIVKVGEMLEVFKRIGNDRPYFRVVQ